MWPNRASRRSEPSSPNRVHQVACAVQFHERGKCETSTDRGSPRPRRSVPAADDRRVRRDRDGDPLVTWTSPATPRSAAAACTWPTCSGAASCSSWRRSCPCCSSVASPRPVGARCRDRRRTVHRRGGQVHHRVERLLLRAGGPPHLRGARSCSWPLAARAQGRRPSLRGPRRAPSRRSATWRMGACRRPTGTAPWTRLRAVGTAPDATDVPGTLLDLLDSEAASRGRLARARLGRSVGDARRWLDRLLPDRLERLLIRVGLLRRRWRRRSGRPAGHRRPGAPASHHPSQRSRWAPSSTPPSPSGCCCSGLVWVAVGAANWVALVLSLVGRHPTGMAIAQYAVLGGLVAGGLLNTYVSQLGALSEVLGRAGTAAPDLYQRRRLETRQAAAAD